MKLRKIAMLVCSLVLLAGFSMIETGCGTDDNGNKDTQQENTNVKDDSSSGTQQENTNVKDDNTSVTQQENTNVREENDTGTQQENTNVTGDSTSDTIDDSGPKGTSENNPLNESTNSNNTDGKGIVTPGSVN